MALQESTQDYYLADTDNEFTNYKWICKNQPRITEGRRLVARVDTCGLTSSFCLVKQEYTERY